VVKKSRIKSMASKMGEWKIHKTCRHPRMISRMPINLT